MPLPQKAQAQYSLLAACRYLFIFLVMDQNAFVLGAVLI